MVTSRTVVIATGARYRKLLVPGYERYELTNIHYAATPIETARCIGQDVVVVGGGNSAGQAALHLAKDAVARILSYVGRRSKQRCRTTWYNVLPVPPGSSCISIPKSMRSWATTDCTLFRCETAPREQEACFKVS